MKELSWLVGCTFTALMALANVSYSMSLAHGSTLGIPTAYIFAALGIALDLAMVLSTLHFKEADRERRYLLAAIFILASAFSVHSLHGFLKNNTNVISTQEVITKSQAKELELRLQDLEKAKKRDYTAIEALRQKLKPQTATPVENFEWYVAIALWFVNATIWYAFSTSKLTPTTELSTKETPQHATGTRDGKVTSNHNGSSPRVHRRSLV